MAKRTRTASRKPTKRPASPLAADPDQTSSRRAYICRRSSMRPFARLPSKSGCSCPANSWPIIGSAPIAKGGQGSALRRVLCGN